MNLNKDSDQRRFQRTLDLFLTAFDDTFSLGNELHNQIQQVKAALYDRDYVKAFESQKNLEAYVVRWSPSRALGYSLLFTSLQAVKDVLARNEPTNVLCIGGGAGAEIVALGSIALLGSAGKIHVTAVDVAQWDIVTDKIVKYVADHWYPKLDSGSSLEGALQAMTLDNSPFSVKFINHDILTLPLHQIKLQDLDFITSMFTTNELFAESKAGTVKFLQSLSACKSGALLLIVESAGSYSEIKIGSKTYPVQFLIHHTLTSTGHWTLENSDDSKWYRLPEGLYYPLKLENMRFFFRLYRRT
jgi:25S rRNA (uracil2843-N3)-methyltransferase